jgi:hypothetical protein
MKSRIQRAGFDLQDLAGVRSYHLADSKAMLFAPLKRLKDEHVQRPLQDFNPVLVRALSRHVDILHQMM